MARKISLGIALLGSCLFAGTALAAPKWTLTTSNGSCTSGIGNSCNFAGTEGALPVSVSAWANTDPNGDNTTLGEARVNAYSGGLGVTHADWESTSSPQHATDNDGRFEVLLFNFDDVVELNEVSFGWWSGDIDFFVMAHIPSTDPGNTDDVNGRLFNASQQDLTDAGWELIGNYDADNSGVYDSSQNAYVKDFNTGPGAVSSSSWLIGAYNPVFASAGCTPSGYCQADTAKDYFKVLSLAGEIGMPPPPPPAAVPEPQMLLLLATGLPLFGWARRRAARQRS
ncbi:MAG: PEP-CTERM sorting domain-containing protein [Gammaproteobacteria bacterium]|nr:PEP-CTERM sorting domain-containing protein [Gammaproteobacteria bacterium]